MISKSTLLKILSLIEGHVDVLIKSVSGKSFFRYADDESLLADWARTLPGDEKFCIMDAELFN